jgi:hypothetical protein
MGRVWGSLRIHQTQISHGQDDFGHTERHTFAIPRRGLRPSLAKRSAPERAWGMPGAQCTRSLVCEVVVQNAHEYSQRSHRKSPGIPARNGFNGLFRALPGDRAFLSPSSADTSANLTPASRRQDHTTSPSALALFVKSAAASIASNPASVTIAIRPSSGVDGENGETDLPETKREKSLKKGLDTRLAKQPVGQISRPHRFRGEQMRCSRTAT